MDTQWLDAWTRFVKGDAGPPGKITTAELLDDNSQPVKDLEATRDYRCADETVLVRTFCGIRRDRHASVWRLLM